MKTHFQHSVFPGEADASFFKNEKTLTTKQSSLSHYQVLEQKQIQLCLLPNNQLCDTEIPHN